jgi:GNAT superfamily N-acetyltransferase
VGFLDLFRPPRLEPLNPPLRRGSLTASARVVTPDQGKALAKKVRARGWQLASFTYRVAIPEVGYVMRFLGNNSTHIRLYAGDRRGDDVVELDDGYGWLPAEDGAPPVYDPDALPPDLVAMARDALDRLTGSSPSGGGAAILAPIVQAFEGPGECWLVGRYDPEADVETWAVHSISEVTAHEGRYPGTPADGPRGYWRLTTGEGYNAETIDLDPATTTVIRLWTADSQWSSEPDSPMRSLVGTCERLLLIDRANDAVLRSRAAGNGFILMPDEMGFGAAPEDDPDAPDETDFQRDMATQLTTPLTQDGSAASVTPGVIYGPYAYLDRIRHLTMERPLDPKLAETEARLLTRLGIGMDVPPEVLTGYADVNHWNVAQVSEDTFKLHQEPVTIKAVEALTLGYMRSVLLDAGWERALVDRVVSWFDPASLIAPRDQRDAANDAFDRGQISGKAYRRLLHLDEADAPEVEATTADAPVGQTGMLATQLGTVLDLAAAAYRAGFRPDSIIERLGLDGWVHTGFRPVTVAEPEVPIIEGGPSIAPEEPAALPAGDTGGGASAEAPAAISAAASTTGAEPTPTQRRLSRRLMTIDRDLRTKLQAAADAALHRALERAGNRLRAKARGNTAAAAAKVDGVPGPLVAAALGRALVAALDADDTDLLREAFDRLRSQWGEWTTAAAEDAIDTAARITGLNREDPAVARTVAALRDSFADAADAAWPALEADLNGLATTLMYEPDPAADALGELPDSLVPPGMIRAALAAVGGLSGDHPGTATAGNPLPGLTSGQLLTAFMRDAGAEPVEYEWAYGISSRPFPPHERLDGQVFAEFTDAVLSTAGTGGEWVGGSFVPGDHKGCHCDYAVIYADGNTRDEQELIGRTAYQEQNPGHTVPGWDATVDGKLGTPRTRPELRRAPAAPRIAADAFTAPTEELAHATWTQGGLTGSDGRTYSTSVQAFEPNPRNPGYAEVTFHVLDPDGTKIGRGIRIIRPVEGGPQVYHDSFILDREYQGLGLASQINLRAEEAYRAGGVTHIATSATSNPRTGYIGGYVWARRGFGWADAAGPHAAAKELRTLSPKHTNPDLDAVIARLEAATVDDLPALPTPHELSELRGKASLMEPDAPLGKRALLRTTWSAVRWLPGQGGTVAAAFIVTAPRWTADFISQQERIYRASLSDRTDPLLVDEAVVDPAVLDAYFTANPDRTRPALRR